MSFLAHSVLWLKFYLNRFLLLKEKVIDLELAHRIGLFVANISIGVFVIIFLYAGFFLGWLSGIIGFVLTFIVGTIFWKLSIRKISIEPSSHLLIFPFRKSVLNLFSPIMLFVYAVVLLLLVEVIL